MPSRRHQGSALTRETDEELMGRMAHGDLNAMGLLFERHHGRVLSLCHRMTGDAHVAEDLAQECFLRVLRYASSFRGEAAFSTWLYRLTRNVCLDHLRADERARSSKEELGREHVAPEPRSTVLEIRLEALRRALYALPPEKREVLVLSRYEGLSYAEIAEVCETTVGAVKVRAHRAMRELRRRFEELEQMP
jgi:RNA polymerase sigma factor (sigma-70 family)